MTTAIGLLILKASLLLAVTFMSVQLLRRGSATRRHQLWSFAFAALVALPLLVVALPTLHVPVPAWNQAVAAPIDVAPIDVAPIDVAPIDVTPTRATAPAPTQTVVVTEPTLPNASIAIQKAFTLPTTRALLFVAWALGALAALSAIVVSIARVARLRAVGALVDTPAWNAARDRIAARLGIVRPVRVVASAGVATPMAGGVIRPTVFVPASATTWSDELRDIVLAHEMAHIASGDPLRHLVSRFAFSLYWFHPLVWLAARRAATAREQACDETVLALGVKPSTYARVLLDFAVNAPARFPSAALPMVKRTLLEERLVAILHPTNPATARRRVVLPATIAALLTLSLAAAHPEPGNPEPPTPIVVAAAPHVTLPPVRLASDAPKAAPFRALPVPCWSDGRDGRRFNGSMSMSDKSGQTVIYEQIGTRGSDHIIQKSFGDLRLCAVAEGLSRDRTDSPSAWPVRASRFVLETERPNDVRRMEFEGGRVTFTVNGSAAALDGAASQWRDALFAVLDLTWDLSQLRGQVSTLRGEISTVYGNRSTLLGEISMLRGELSTMRGEISDVRGRESSLRGEISMIRGHLSTLNGQISSERGAISSLEGSRYDVSAGTRDRLDDRIRQHRQTIRQVEEEIQRYDVNARVRDVERRIDALDPDREVAAIERRIREFDIDAKTAAVQRRIDALDVSRHVGGIEQQITSLDAERRGAAIESRRDTALTRLNSVLGRR